eukprot:scaffold4522_cov18-Tisochrysis_lutea.AAC.1
MQGQALDFEAVPGRGMKCRYARIADGGKAGLDRGANRGLEEVGQRCKYRCARGSGLVRWDKSAGVWGMVGACAGVGAIGEGCRKVGTQASGGNLEGSMRSGEGGMGGPRPADLLPGHSLCSPTALSNKHADKK